MNVRSSMGMRRMLSEVGEMRKRDGGRFLYKLQGIDGQLQRGQGLNGRGRGTLIVQSGCYMAYHTSSRYSQGSSIATE